MRVLAVIAILAGLLVGTIGAAPAEAAKRQAKPTCAKKGSKTVARSRSARVFTTGSKAYARLYGCWRATGRRFHLATRQDDIQTASRFSDVRLAGRYVAWYGEESDLSCVKYSMCPPGVSTTTGTVQVFDLRARRTVRASPASVTSPGLALTQRGAVAWVSGSGAGAEVRVADTAGARTLDTGVIAPASLRAEISIVSWVRDGVERFARLR